MTSTPPSPALQDPAWRGRVLWGLTALVMLWPALVAVEFRPWVLFEPTNLRVWLRFVADFFPPLVDREFLLLIAREAWVTIAVATSGMALALLLAAPLTLLSSAALSISSLSGRMHPLAFAVRQLVRWLMVVLRSVPELIWALVFVRVLGLGPASGVVAIGLTYAGMLGKVYGEILESGDRQPSQCLLQAGAGRLQALLYGLIPQNSTELASYSVYRWECAIRSSAVLGFVGAGGLGQQMDASMKMFNGGEVSTILIVFMLLVGFGDQVSAALRRMIQ